jgi:hypothetical protein
VPLILRDCVISLLAALKYRNTAAKVGHRFQKGVRTTVMVRGQEFLAESRMRAGDRLGESPPSQTLARVRAADVGAQPLGLRPPPGALANPRRFGTLDQHASHLDIGKTFSQQ